jgi:hypothetical protein
VGVSARLAVIAGVRNPSMTDEKKPFTVSDRRHFNTEGEARSDDEPAAPVPPPAGSSAAPRPTEPASSQGPGPMPALPAGLPGVFLLLYMEAGVRLGLMGAAGERPQVDLTTARAFIDMLVVLRDKTAGNRTPEEDRLLEDLLYQLQMAFVEVSKAGA